MLQFSTLSRFFIFVSFLALFMFKNEQVAHAQSQSVQLFIEDFNFGMPQFILNAPDVGSNSGINSWIVNDEYDGGGVYPNTTGQDMTVSGTIGMAPNSDYLHIYDETAVPTANANYNPDVASDRFVVMSDGVCTKGLIDVVFAFFYIGEGGPNAGVEVYYSRESGPWTQVGESLYGGQDTWKYEVIEDPAFDNTDDLKFGFRWVNDGGGEPVSIGFGVDDIQIVGTYDDATNGITIDITSVPETVCRGTNLVFSFALSDTLCDGTYGIELSNAMGNFTPPAGTWVFEMAYPTTAITLAITLPNTLPAGDCYQVRVNRVFPPPLITGIASVCFIVEECPNTITTLQPSVTLDPEDVCVGSVIDVPFWSTGVFNPGNFYSAILTNMEGTANYGFIGGFSSGMTFDPALVPSPGTVAGLVPEVPPGCDYYVQVNSSFPFTNGTVWGPFCIKECDINTNDRMDIAVCITPTEGETVEDVPIDINIYTMDAIYDPDNEFIVEVLDPMSLAQVNWGGLGIIPDFTSNTFDLIIPPLPDLFGLGMMPGLWYVRIVATNSSTSDNVWGTIIRLTIGSPQAEPLIIIASDTLICQNDIGNLQVLDPDPASTYQWFLNGNEFPPNSPQNPIFVNFNSEPGTVLTFTVQETNFGCLGDLAPVVPIEILSPPINVITGPTPVCPGDVLEYQVPFVNNTYYEWSLTNGAIVDTGNHVISLTLDSFEPAVLTLESLNACGSGFGDFLIETLPPPDVTLNDDMVICEGETITITAAIDPTNVSTYWWEQEFPGFDFNLYIEGAVPEITVTPDTTTTYYLVIDGTVCDNTDSVHVEVIPIPDATITGDLVVCEGIIPTLTTGEALNYMWSNGETTQSIEPDMPGAYSVTLDNGNGCTDTDMVDVVFEMPPVIDLGADEVRCSSDDPLILDAGNTGLTFEWSTGDVTQTITADATDIYSVTVTSALGCSAIDAIDVTINEAPIADLGEDQIICTDGAAPVLDAGNPGMTYEWSTGAMTQTIEAPTTDTYWVEISNGICTDRDTVEILFNPPIVVDLGADTDLCEGEVQVLDAGNAGLSFEWLPNGETTQTIDATTTGTYTVIVRDIDGCEAMDEITLTFNAIPAVNLGPDQIICAEETIPVLDAQNTGFAYEWSTGSTAQTLTPTLSGTYWVEVTNENCSAIDSVEIILNPALTIDLGIDTDICQGDILTLDAQNTDLTFAWSTGANTQTIEVANAGTYSVVVTDDNGCTITDEVNIAVNPLPFADLGGDRVVCQNNLVVLDAGSQNAAFEWSTGTQGQTFQPTESGMYWVNVTNECGIAQDTVNISIDRCNLPCILVPNAFSPNEDGINDVFKPIYDCTILAYRFKVYNRWGEIVFETTNPDEGWDGQYKLQSSEMGVYVWFIDMQRLTDEGDSAQETHKGNVTLVR